VHGWPRLWLALAVSAPLVLALGRLLPAEGPGLAFRLAGAAGCVLLLPGACVVRLTGERAIGLQLVAALVWSLVAVFGVFIVVFALGASLGVAVGLLAVVTLLGLIVSMRASRLRVEAPDRNAVGGLLVLGAALAGALWWAIGTIGGSLGPDVSDALFHLGRIRKLDDAGSLDSIRVVNEFDDGTTHPGYAFPLWHGALALVARLAGVDPTLVVLYLPPLLAPLAVLIAYAAGRELFRSTSGGVATALSSLALVAFAFGGVGRLQFLSQPGGASRYLLVPGLLALVLAYVAEGRRGQLAGIGAAALVLAVIHPTYVVFLGFPLAGFLLATGVLGGGVEIRRIGMGLAAIVLPTGLYFLWLVQFLGDADDRSTFLFMQQLETVGSGLRLGAEQLAWGGGTKVVALASVPLALLASRRRWAAYVLGGTLALMLVALVPQLFERLAEITSVQQATRLGGFLPLSFALAGAALLAARLRLLGVLLAAGVGIVAQLAFGGPATEASWLVWAVSISAALGLLAFAFARPLDFERDVRGSWAVFAALALAVPAAVSGFSTYERWDEPDPAALTGGLTTALRDEVEPLAVVLAPSPSSYRIAGYAPARVVITPPGHFPFSRGSDYRARDAAADRFFFEPDVSPDERAVVLRRYGVSWVVVDLSHGHPVLPSGLTEVYADERYVLYRVETRQEQT
jgi:hypothetical protein